MKSILEALILGLMISVLLTLLSLGMRASLNDLVCLFRPSRAAREGTALDVCDHASCRDSDGQVL